MNLSALHSLSVPESHTLRRAGDACSLLILLLVFAATSGSKAEESLPPAQAIDFLVVKAALLTGSEEPSPVAPDPRTPAVPSPNVISILQGDSAVGGDANDYVLEHVPFFVANAFIAEDSSRTAYTVWSTFDPQVMDVSLSDDGRSISVVTNEESDFRLFLTLESDADSISPGVYADGDSWFRVNTFEDLGDGRLSLDIEYSLPIAGARQSARLRTRTPGRVEDEPFTSITAAEWLAARPGGVATHLIVYDDSPRAGPPLFGDQFDPHSVLSREEALLRVTRDREILNARDDATDDTSNNEDFTSREPVNRSKSVDARDRRTPTRNAQATLPDPNPMDAGPTDPSNQAGGGIGLAAPALKPEPAATSGNPQARRASSKRTTDDRRRSSPLVPRTSRPALRDRTATSMQNHSGSAPIQPSPHPAIASTREDQESSLESATSVRTNESKDTTEPPLIPRVSAAVSHPADRTAPRMDSSAVTLTAPNKATKVAERGPRRSDRTFRQALGSALEQARAQFREFLHTALKWWQEKDP